MLLVCLNTRWDGPACHEEGNPYRYTAGIFQIELDFLARLPELQRLGFAATMLFNAARLAQNLPDRGLRARQAHTGAFERRIAVEVVQDRFWPRDALQVLGRLDSDLQNALHDGGLGGDGGWWRVASTRAGTQRRDISGIGLTQPLEPLAHPGV